MSSAAKTSANRANARKSTGPRSTRGKSKSRLNALKLGIYAATPVLPGEDEDAYHQIVESNLEHFAPVGPVENLLVGQITTEQWRLERIQRAENAFFSRQREGEIVKFLRSLNDSEMAYVSSAYNDELSDQIKQARARGKSIFTLRELQMNALTGPTPPKKVPVRSDQEVKDFVDAELGRILDPDNTLLEGLVPAMDSAPQAKLVHEQHMAMRALLAYVSKLAELQEVRLMVTLLPRPRPMTSPEKRTHTRRFAPSPAENAANQYNSETVNSSRDAKAPPERAKGSVRYRLATPHIQSKA